MQSHPLAKGRHRRTPGLALFPMLDSKNELLETLRLAEENLKKLAERMQTAQLDAKHGLKDDFFHQYIAGQSKELLKLKDQISVMSEISDAQTKIFKTISEAYLVSASNHARLLDRIIVADRKTSALSSPTAKK